MLSNYNGYNNDNIELKYYASSFECSFIITVDYYNKALTYSSMLILSASVVSISTWIICEFI
jgi:hypothetical protein